MTDVKQVKVDNWGIYFLQRLKHFFNRTDYCDLTLQFQDNAQLKVHRLVLNACTEYFELLERTCEMYEDCLVMPDDLQADVVVPIVNFMYTGHLEFRMDMLERLYQTSQILNMPVLSKLLESHRQTLNKTPQNSYSGIKKYPKVSEPAKVIKPAPINKRSYSKAFDNNVVHKEKRIFQLRAEQESTNNISTYQPPIPAPVEPSVSNKKSLFVDPRPTRYELPEELDTDNVFDNSFCNISYTCQPLMVHPDTVKRYSSKRTGIFNEASSSKKLLPGTSTVDIVECKRISKDDNIFEDSMISDDADLFQTSYNTEKDSSQLFDQILDDGPKVTIETKDTKAASNLDHAKIISEVLKKYPHLVKSNKNIKLKILNTPTKTKKQQKPSPTYVEDKPKLKTEEPDYTYETDVLDSQQAAKLIALGAENTKGPWICLICGTPGKALHFTSYYKFRRHLVEVHNEKPVSNICEYCGLRSLKRNYLLHHLYSQHGVEPPPQYNFPKCNRCSYIALTEGLLVKHKMTHKDVRAFRCNVCSAPFSTTRQLLQHIQATGHKYSAERKTNLQCIYCLKTFLRDGNLYAHLKTYHKKEAKNDGVIEDSDDEVPKEPVSTGAKIVDIRDKYSNVKFEPSTSYDNDFEEIDMQQYQIHQRHDGDIQITPKKQHNVISNQKHNVVTIQQHGVISNQKQKILNPGFGSPKLAQKSKPVRKPPQPQTSNFLEDINIPSPPNTQNEEEIVLIDNTEYIMRDNQLIPRKSKPDRGDYIIADMMESASIQSTPSMEYTSVNNAKILEEAQAGMLVKKGGNINQPIQIVVSNEEEYKALMASNHPILFDNGDSNKTLTVLTAPHNSTMQSATIDMDNTQSNDMMIIQEDFPLNVTESVATDNSNIVVVYSHPVDDQNKQFQILTTGGIGSQYVQSSAILTQNYETVTTSAPTMSAQLLQTQPDTTWQDGGQIVNSQEVELDPQAELQHVVQNVEIKQTNKETSDNLNELPEVHLACAPEPVVPQDHIVDQPVDHIDNTSNELNIINAEHIQQVEPEINEAQTLPETPLETESNIVEEQETSAEPMEITQENETIPEDSTPIHTEDTTLIHTEDTTLIHVEDTTVNIEAFVEQPIENEIIEEQTSPEVAEIVPQEEEAPHEVQAVEPMNVSNEPVLSENADLINTLEESQPATEEPQPVVEASETFTAEQQPLTETEAFVADQPLPESQAYDDIVEINQEPKELPETFTKKTDEKIQNLTSEWSEDEYDVAEDAAATLEKVHAPVVPMEQEPELEETIENIQQEVLNHMSCTAKITATIEHVPEAENAVTENSISESTIISPVAEVVPQTDQITEEVSPVQNNPETQEKISSLLNDWEDNDSQEENNTDSPTVEKILEPTTDVTIEKITNTENIKSLVSDWDEEEEEVKE